VRLKADAVRELNVHFPVSS